MMLVSKQLKHFGVQQPAFLRIRFLPSEYVYSDQQRSTNEGNRCHKAISLHCLSTLLPINVFSLAVTGAESPVISLALAGQDNL